MRRNPAAADMSVTECWEKLRGANLARIALSARALPVILPVQYHVRDGLIVMCLGPEQPFEPVIDGAVAAFAVESLEPGTASGWTVHVQGVVRRVPPADRRQGCPLHDGVLAGLQPFVLVGWHVELCPLDQSGRVAPLT